MDFRVVAVDGEAGAAVLDGVPCRYRAQCAVAHGVDHEQTCAKEGIYHGGSKSSNIARRANRADRNQVIVAVATILENKSTLCPDGIVVPTVLEGDALVGIRNRDGTGR